MDKIAPSNVTMNFSQPVGYGETPAVAENLLKNANKLSKKLLKTDKLEIDYRELMPGHQGFRIKILRQAEEGLKEVKSSFLTTLWTGIMDDAECVPPNEGVELAKQLIKESKPTTFQKILKLAANIIKR